MPEERNRDSARIAKTRIGKMMGTKWCIHEAKKWEKDERGRKDG